ncbi:hypothetical protein BU23DRAFT_595216 [Bimuria novae-zelandiae CBS 107.79]|uniref:Uncharacterized protein n=1 Tax=Bimuria novae-zelandiae CBS 107.79 TaxID=1447943 RepID=A0A6A5VRT7_9PLEO|nr:hypothetical protein BU23DRAFT_595216 [Bimuria novae-zelandiae CBS 107.79]
MPAKLLESHFPYIHARSTSSTDLSKPPKSTSKSSSGPSSPTTPRRPQPTRASSHPGPASQSTPSPKPKQPARAFGTNYRVRRTPPSSPPNGLSSSQPLGPAHAHSNVRDFANISSSAAHSQPTRRKPVYSMHEADPAVKGRSEVVYTDDELLKRLNTIGESDEVDVERVKTVDREKERKWEEKRKRKEEREMEEWNRREALKARKAMTRGFSWKGVKNVVGGFR